MHSLYTRLQPVLLIAAVACLAFTAGERWHAPTTVHASSSSTTPFFQLSGVGPGTAISYYSASDHAIYIYQGATTGNAVVPCSYKFTLDEAGKPLRRENCPIHFGR
jgi:hypothetical protein